MIVKSDREFIDGFAEGYERFGQTRLMGRIVAILLLSEEALSLDDISQKLDVSKGPVSTEARKLEMLWTVEVVRKSGDRKTYYQVVDDPFVRALDRNIELTRKNLTLAQKWVSSEKNRKNTKSGKRIAKMNKFYHELVHSLEQFSYHWKTRDEDDE
ncbi:MAG: hypothetical protein H8D46_01375 [FCB group bacterium]|nr:hypothetical protein [FCB group bacterium]